MGCGKSARGAVIHVVEEDAIDAVSSESRYVDANLEKDCPIL